MAEYLDLSAIELPAFLLNAPLSLSADVPNNIFMAVKTAEQRRVDKHKALRQFHELYAFMSSYSLVYLLPSRPGLQDQPFVSNLGVVLPHLGWWPRPGIRGLLWYLGATTVLLGGYYLLEKSGRPDRELSGLARNPLVRPALS